MLAVSNTRKPRNNPAHLLWAKSLNDFQLHAEHSSHFFFSYLSLSCYNFPIRLYFMGLFIIWRSVNAGRIRSRLNIARAWPWARLGRSEVSWTEEKGGILQLSVHMKVPGSKTGVVPSWIGVPVIMTMRNMSVTIKRS